MTLRTANVSVSVHWSAHKTHIHHTFSMMVLCADVSKSKKSEGPEASDDRACAHDCAEPEEEEPTLGGAWTPDPPEHMMLS